MPKIVMFDGGHKETPIFIVYFRADDWPALEVMLKLSPLHSRNDRQSIDYVLRSSSLPGSAIHAKRLKGFSADSMIQLFYGEPKEAKWIPPIKVLIEEGRDG